MEMQFIPSPNGVPRFRFRERAEWNPAVEERAEGLEILTRLIRENPEAPQRELANLAADEGIGRDKAEKILKEEIGRRWRTKKGPKGKIVYRILNQE